MNRPSLITFFQICFILTFTPLFSQDIARKDLGRSVQEADLSFYYDKDYEKAASLYEPLLEAYPGNSNLAARLGICYLNIDGKKKDALRLLSAAATNVVNEEKDYTEYGEKAPLNTYMYLAIAYHVNDSLEKALSLYNELKQKLGDNETYMEEYYDRQIGYCRYAREMKKRPMTILSELFVPWLSEYPGACNPVISKNDSVFVFTQKREGKTRILCSYKNKNWSTPVDITEQLGGYDRFYSNSVTGDGKLLVLFMDDGGDGNLYFSQRKDTTWTRIKGPGRNINSIYWESHGFITPDGKTLYFSSNRPGGEGELDIWSSTKNDDDSWSRPLNLGNIINTPFNEDTPFFDPASGALIFSSAGHISMGGYDVFRSVLKYDYWTNPVAMPYAFNTTADNTFFILNNNAPGFVASLYNEGENSRNIYAVVARDPSDEITALEGFISLNDGLKPVPEKISVKLTNFKKGSDPQSLTVDMEDKFRTEIKPGDYQIYVSYPGYKTDSIKLNLPLYFLSRYVQIQSKLVPEKKAESKYLAINNILFAFNSLELDSQAIQVLEELKSILISHPELKVEVAGYADARGSYEYNLQLAEKRVDAVINYLASPRIPASRFIRKAFGRTNFIAVNTNNDGTDNPEGRKYNRRVSFGIIDPQTGIRIRQDTYTPEHLRLPSSMKYSIVLKRSVQNLPDGYFNELSLGGRLFVRSIESDSLSLYVLGVFYNQPEAVKYLEYAKERGFKEAYIINQYDLNGEAKYLYNLIPVVSSPAGKKIYTIQVKAARSAINMNSFNNIPGVREILNNDGYYRYVTGEYNSLSDAKKALQTFKDTGFKDAFIRELNLLIVK
jgi:outer membrane protein OmpA-like peptidoglycan-associated protein/TPR repeat protein